MYIYVKIEIFGVKQHLIYCISLCPLARCLTPASRLINLLLFNFCLVLLCCILTCPVSTPSDLKYFSILSAIFKAKACMHFYCLRLTCVSRCGLYSGQSYRMFSTLAFHEYYVILRSIKKRWVSTLNNCNFEALKQCRDAAKQRLWFIRKFMKRRLMVYKLFTMCF